MLILLHQTHAEELNLRAPNVASSSTFTTNHPADDLPTALQHRMAQEEADQQPNAADKDNETQNDEHSKDHSKDDADTGGNSTGIPLPVLIIGFGFGAYMARKRMLDHNSLYEGRWIVGGNDPDADVDRFDDDGYNVQSRTGGNEMISLSNEDEWGWEDNAHKDLEMGSVRAQNTTDSTQDLNAVLASSSNHSHKSNGNGNGKSGSNRNYHHNNANASVSVTGSQRSTMSQSTNSEMTFQTSNVHKRPSVIKSNSGNKLEDGGLQNDAWDDERDWDEGGEKKAAPAPASAPVSLPSSATKPSMIPKGKKSPPMAPKVAPVQPPAMTVEELLAEQLKHSHAPAITSLSLSKPKAAAAAKPKEIKNDEDDIFASMGLASIPSKAVKAPVSVPVPAPAPVQSSWKSENLTVTESADVDAGSDWGDDGDLDDLLDE